MLAELLYALREVWSGWNIFQYISVRAALAALTAFGVSIAAGPSVIRGLARWRMTQQVRQDEAPALYPLHRDKRGTPTMGGLLILLAVGAAVLLWGALDNPALWLVVGVTLWLGAVGWVDDYLKFVHQRSTGLPAAVKFVGQSAAGVFLGIALHVLPGMETTLTVPVFKHVSVELGIWYVAFVWLVIVGSSNAVNLTDGLDGLAIGCTVMVAFAYGALSYVSGHATLAAYLHLPFHETAGELTVFCAALVGAGLGFLWYNAHPAEVFMGDTGALALGGAIGTVAVLIQQELLLLVIGGVFVAEALSVILQVGSFKLRGRRIFAMSPLHHHFQIGGWAESKVTIRFWIIAALLALMGIASVKVR